MDTQNNTPHHQPIWKQKNVYSLLIVALLAEIGYALLNMSAMPVYLKNDLGITTSVIGFVVATFLLSEAFFKSITGQLADQIGRKRLIIPGTAITIFTPILTLLIPKSFGACGIAMIMMLRVLDGIGIAMFWPAAFALMSEEVGKKDRAQSMALLNTCYLIGVAIAMPLGGLVNDLTQQKEASFILTSIIFTALTYYAWRYIKPDKEIPPLRTVLFSNKWTYFKDIYKAATHIPHFVMLAMMTFMSIGLLVPIIKIFAEAQFGLSEASFGLIFIPGALGLAFLATPISNLVKDYKTSKTVLIGNIICSIGMLIISSGAVIPFMRNLFIMGIASIPVGIGFLMAVPSWYSFITNINPKKSGTYIGVMLTAQGIGMIMGTPIGGASYQFFQVIDPDFGRYSPLILSTICVTACIPIAVSLRKTDTSS